MVQRDALREFHYFSRLPAEIRVQIWGDSFEPRILELHSSPPHHAANRIPLWYSCCVNPVGLSVCHESRAEALAFYSVPLPLGGEYGRYLYLNPSIDTLVILGEVDYWRTHALLSLIASLHPAGQGLQRFGLSVTCWTYKFAGATLRTCSKTIFNQLDQFVLLMYTDVHPPVDFTGGHCVLEDCKDKDDFTEFVRKWGHEFWDGERWITVGRSEMKIMGLKFVSP